MQKRGDAVKKAMLSAASQSFHEEGYRSASVDSIAQRAGVSKATVYSHFKSKEGLFRAVVEELVSPILEHLPPPRPVDDVREELIRFAETLSKFLLSPEKVEWDRMMVATAKRFPQLANNYFEAGPAQGMRRLAAFLSAQDEAGSLVVSDPEFSTELLCGMLFGTRILRNLVCNQQSTLDRPRIEKVIDAFLKVHAP